MIAGGFIYMERQKASQETGTASSVEKTGDASFETALKFANAASCTPTEGFKDLLDRIALAAAEPAGSAERLVKIAGHDEEFDIDVTRSGTGENEVQIARVDLIGQWQGLRLTELRLARWDDGTTESLQLRFADDLAQAASALKQLGFPILPEGKSSRVDGTFIGLERVNGGNALVCVRGNNAAGDEPAEDASSNTAASQV